MKYKGLSWVKSGQPFMFCIQCRKTGHAKKAQTGRFDNNPQEKRPEMELDILRDNLKIVFCTSVSREYPTVTGSYHTGPGDKFWAILHKTGLTPIPLQPNQYPALTIYRLGLTFYNNHRGTLLEKMKRYGPQILCFNGKKAAKGFMGKRSIDYGFQQETIGPAKIFVAPSTSRNAGKYWDEKWWFLLADSVRCTVKEINRDNYYRPDETCSLMETTDFNSARIIRPAEEDFVQAVSVIRLNNDLPLHIRNMFEIAKALFAYGYLYFPFCSLAVEQALKSLEAVITYKYEAIGGPIINRKGWNPALKEKIEYLYAMGIVSYKQKKVLHDCRHLRNVSFHPKNLQILGHYDGALRVLASLMNEIWAGR